MRIKKQQFNIKIDGKEYRIPRSWADITIQQYYDLRRSNPQDKIETLSIVLGCPYGIIHRTRQVDIEEIVDPLIQFLNTKLVDENLPPASKITIGGIGYDAPKDLMKYSYGQRVYAENELNESLKEHQDVNFCMHKILACYYYPIVFDRHFDDEEVKYQEFEKDMLNASVLEGINTFNFFLQSFKLLERRKTRPYPLNLIRNKWLRGYIDWVFSKRSIRLMNSQGVIYSNGKK